MRNDKKRVLPGINMLTEEQIVEVHQKAMHILASTGIRVRSKKALQLFQNRIGGGPDGELVKISGDVIQWAIEKTPKDISLKDRLGKEAFTLRAGEKRQTRFGIGCTNTHFQEVDSDRVVPFMRSHNKLSVRLGQELTSYDLISSIGIPGDVPASRADMYVALDHYANTTKPIMLLLLEDKYIEQVFELIQLLNNNRSPESVLCYVNPITPLILNDATARKIDLSAEYDWPLVYSNYGMYGASTPMEPAGSLALMHAELLAGLVYCQLVKEGSRVILGSLPASFDMSTMASVYGTSSMLLNLACAEILAYLKIPHCGTSGSGIGWGADLPASDHLWMNHLTSCLGPVGMVPFVGGNFNSLVFSPNMAVYSGEIINQVRDFIKGFDLDDQSFSLDEIERAGPGGDFLTSEKTLNQLTDKKQHKNLWSGMSLEQWQWEGSPKAVDKLRELTNQLLSESKPPEDLEELTEKGEKFISSVK